MDTRTPSRMHTFLKNTFFKIPFHKQNPKKTEYERTLAPSALLAQNQFLLCSLKLFLSPNNPKNLKTNDFPNTFLLLLTATIFFSCVFSEIYFAIIKNRKHSQKLSSPKPLTSPSYANNFSLPLLFFTNPSTQPIFKPPS